MIENIDIKINVLLFFVKSMKKTIDIINETTINLNNFEKYFIHKCDRILKSFGFTNVKNYNIYTNEFYKKNTIDDSIDMISQLKILEKKYKDIMQNFTKGCIVGGNSLLVEKNFNVRLIPKILDYIC